MSVKPVADALAERVVVEITGYLPDGTFRNGDRIYQAFVMNFPGSEQADVVR